MKIKTRLTLRYTYITAITLLVFSVIIYICLERNRSKEFFQVLKKEAITKANLFLDNRVDAHTMQLIYLNNLNFIDEVEVAIYDVRFNLLYHDAIDIDIIEEDEKMISEIIRKEEIEFYIDDYQGVGMVYPYKGEMYVLTAAAYDGKGIMQRNAIVVILVLIWVSGVIFCFFIGKSLAESALKPVADMVDEVEHITESNLDTRIQIVNRNDEIGELGVTFNNMLDRLRTSFDSQKMFVSNVAHELRTPLTALIAEFELGLLKERTNEQYCEIIKNAKKDTVRLERLSAGLLDFARANYDTSLITMKEIRLDELLLDARETVCKIYDNYKINIIFEKETENEQMITVIGNEYLLKTAVVNLIENNCKYSQDKTSRIHISYYDDKSILRFEDTGIGIAQADMENLFKPFFRGMNVQNIEGNGIGLALVHKIITLHRGTIKVDSLLDKGTVFIIELPHI
ncbi:MAG: HAMP domain-containing histidine kinase [Odoribacter sp.]|nr:HAMP domain-containing histidine kinase [Odoribacter sp.]